MTGTGKPLSFLTKISYGMGDLFGGGATTILSMYYLYFLTDVIRLKPAIAGSVILISKIWDAVTDPFMGVISDNTRTRWGRRRPYFFAGIFLIFISFTFLWSPVPFSQEWLKFLYVLAGYLLFSTVYTIVGVPYNSIAAELTDNYDERTRLSTYRMIFSNLAGVLGATLSMDIFVTALNKDNPARGFFMMGTVFGLFFALPYIMTFLFCRENPEFQKQPRIKIESWGGFIRDFIVEPLKVRPFRNVVLMYLFGFMAQDTVMVLAVYFMTYYLGIQSMMTLLVPVFGAMILAIPLVELISMKIGKRLTYMLSCLVWVLSFGLVLLMKPGISAVLVYSFGILFGFAGAGVQVMVFAMFPDIPDVDELFSGRRREGLFSGIFAFLRKTGGALIMFFVGSSIQWAGYRAPVEIEGPAGVILEQQVQTPFFLNTLLWLFILIPCVFIIIAGAACRKYKVSKAIHNQLTAFLHKRKTGQMENSQALRDEEVELKLYLQGRLEL